MFRLFLDSVCSAAEHLVLGDSASSRLFEVQHFRPKIKAMGLDGVVSNTHYWWLAYEWSNMYLSCQLCKSLKATRFPIFVRFACRS